jgi:uncharacterized cysteine cluster protein YcgN (CxxCxxCC family)
MDFWRTKTLVEMTTEEWESLCDNCGKCCLHKLEDEDTGHIAFTRVACRLLDLTTCRCTRYRDRTRLVPECIDLKQAGFVNYHWLPSTCAYRLLSEGKPLFAWHPLLTGNHQTIRQAGMTISRYALTETEVLNHDLEDHVIDWLD